MSWTAPARLDCLFSVVIRLATTPGARWRPGELAGGDDEGRGTGSTDLDRNGGDGRVDPPGCPLPSRQSAGGTRVVSGVRRGDDRTITEARRIEIGWRDHNRRRQSPQQSTSNPTKADEFVLTSLGATSDDEDRVCRGVTGFGQSVLGVHVDDELPVSQEL